MQYEEDATIPSLESTQSRESADVYTKRERERQTKRARKKKRERERDAIHRTMRKSRKVSFIRVAPLMPLFIRKGLRKCKGPFLFLFFAT